MEVELKEEKAKLEQELRTSVRDLGEILFQNDELIKENNEKAISLGEYESAIKEMKEKNVAELAQLQAEESTTNETCTHELLVKEAEFTKLKNFYDRFKSMQEENETLQEEINNLMQKSSEERFAFADVMHQMNRSMKSKRQHLEETLKRELNDMDLTCQLKAFASLDEKKKKEMLTNAKLKDELALQSIGIANLGARLTRQTEAMEKTKKKIARMEEEANILRQELIEIRIQETTRNNAIEVCRKETESLQEKFDKIMIQKDQTKLSKIQKQLNIEYQIMYNEKMKLIMWETRYQNIKEIFEDMNLPSDPFETGTKIDDFSRTHLKVRNDLNSPKKSPGILASATHSIDEDSVSNFDNIAESKNPESDVGQFEGAVMTLSKYRHYLSSMGPSSGFVEMMAPLKGKEASVLFNNGIAALDTNIPAWVVHEIARVWHSTEFTERPIVEEKDEVQDRKTKKDRSKKKQYKEEGSTKQLEIFPKSQLSIMDDNESFQSIEVPIVRHKEIPDKYPNIGLEEVYTEAKTVVETNADAMRSDLKEELVSAKIEVEAEIENSKDVHGDVQPPGVPLRDIFSSDDREPTPLTDTEIADLWDKMDALDSQNESKSVLMGDSLSEASKASSNVKMLKSCAWLHTAEPDTFIRSLGNSKSMVSTLQRIKGGGAMHVQSHSALEPLSRESFDKDTGINIDCYKFTNTIIGGEVIPPSMSVKPLSKTKSEKVVSTTKKSEPPPRVKLFKQSQSELNKMNDGLMKKRPKFLGISSMPGASDVNGSYSQNGSSTTKSVETHTSQERLKIRKGQIKLMKQIEKTAQGAKECLVFPPLRLTRASLSER